MAGPEPAHGPHERPEGVDPTIAVEAMTPEQLRERMFDVREQILDADSATLEGSHELNGLQRELIVMQDVRMERMEQSITDLRQEVRNLAGAGEKRPLSKRRIAAGVLAGVILVGAVFGGGIAAAGGFNGSGHGKKPVAAAKKNKKSAPTSGGATTVSSQAVFGSKLPNVIADFENEIKSLGAVASADAAQAHTPASTSPNTSPTPNTPNTSASTASKSSGAETASDPSVARAEHARTVAQAVRDLHSTPQTIDGNVQSIMDQAHPNQALDHSHGSESSQRAVTNHIGLMDAVEIFAFDTANSPANLAQQYNALHGVQNDGQLPAGISHEHARKFVENYLLSKNTTFSIDHPHGIFGDAGQRGENVFRAHNITLNGDKAVFNIESPGMPTLHFLISNDAQAINNLCFNNIYPIMQVTMPTPEQPVTPAPAQHAPETPQPKHHPKPHHPHHPRQPRAPRTPVTPPNTPPTTTPPNTPPNHHTPKVDPNTTPAGVPGESGGTGTNTPTTGPGEGPAGQTPGPTGFLPGESSPPNTSPATPTPPPVETQPAPNPPSTPEQGQDGGASQPTSGSSSTGTTVNGTPTVPTS